YEHVQAVSVGIGSTYSMRLTQKDVEACPQKYAIFRTIRTWEHARAANAFNRQLKKELVNPANQFHLEEVDANTWKLYKTNLDGSNPRLYRTVRRGDGIIRF
ncbi:MAG: hypothetical protein J7576_23145, partial [Siphonobacter aquaeclarae]|nr:hypothetical protein [Siphonobacter aquaeclarae]